MPKMSKTTLTTEWLRAYGACPEGIEWFHMPNGVGRKLMLLIAGNHDQVADFIRRSVVPRSQFRCVHERRDILGLHAENVERVIRTGEYWLNPMNHDDSMLQLEAKLHDA